MFNNVVIDIVIGLILIYLLYSLFMTILSEFIVFELGVRERVLRLAVERMLNDGYYERMERKVWWGFLQGIWRRLVLYEAPEFTTSFAGRFYAQPSIKYLARTEKKNFNPFSKSKPAYISSEYFANSLITMFREKGVGESDMEKIQFCLKFNTLNIQPQTLNLLRGIVTDSENDPDKLKLKIKKWFEEMMDRANGWYKGKLKLILFILGFFIAAIFNVDSIGIARILAKDEDARDQLVKMGIELSKDTARYEPFLQNKDSTHAKTVLDSGLTRVTKDLDNANLVLGLGWGLSKLEKNDNIVFVIDSSRENDSLLKNWILQKQGADILTAELKKNTLSIDSQVHQLLAAQKKSFKNQYSGDTSGRAKQWKLDSETINKIKFELLSRISETHIDSIISKSLNDSIQKQNELFAKLTGKSYSNISFVSDGYFNLGAKRYHGVKFSGKRNYNQREKFRHILSGIFSLNLRFLGFIITALAISLGANFWFDLLKKLVAIRSSGVKPEEKKPPPIVEDDIAAMKKDLGVAPPPPPKAPEPKGDFIDEALRLYADQLKQIPGVVSVFIVFREMAEGQREKTIQVNISDPKAKNELTTKFPVLKVGEEEIEYKIVESGQPVTHGGNIGYINNQSGMNSSGSLGMVLKRVDTGSLHILSCWHVMKGDQNYNADDDFRTITDYLDKEFAQRWSGGIKEHFDYGIASCNSNYAISNNFLKEKLQMGNGQIKWREINNSDIMNQVPVKFYDCLSGEKREGFIFTSSDEMPIEYADQKRIMKRVILLTDDNEQAISQPGNSGSIVFDEKNTAIAIIIAGDLHYTYALPLSPVFQIHNEMRIV